MRTLNEVMAEKVMQDAVERDIRVARGLPVWDVVKDFLRDINRGIPVHYVDAKMPDEYNERILSALERNKGIYLYGPVGTGKTYLLFALLRLLRANCDTTNDRYRSYSINLWDFPSLLSRLKQEFSEDGGGEVAIDEQIKSTGVVFLDDFGAEKTTDWSMEIMYRLVNFRYENVIPTYFASNLSIEELGERCGDRIASRIVGSCDVIKVDGKDRRLEEKQITEIENKKHL